MRPREPLTSRLAWSRSREIARDFARGLPEISPEIRPPPWRAGRGGLVDVLAEHDEGAGLQLEVGGDDAPIPELLELRRPARVVRHVPTAARRRGGGRCHGWRRVMPWPRAWTRQCCHGRVRGRISDAMCMSADGVGGPARAEQSGCVSGRMSEGPPHTCTCGRPPIRGQRAAARSRRPPAR